MIHAGPDLLDLLADLEPPAVPDHFKVGEPFVLPQMPDHTWRIHLCTRCRYTCTEPRAAAGHRCPPTKD